MWWPSASASIRRKTLPYRSLPRSKSAPLPQPRAETMSVSSLFPATFAEFACSAFRTLPAEREDRLRLPVAPLLGRAARRVALHDEELRLGRVGRGAVGELARQVQAVRDRRLARHLLGRGARRLAGARRHDDPADDLLGDGGVLVEPVLEGRPHRPVHLRGDLGVVEPLLRLALELRLEDVDGEERDEPLADVLGRRARRPSAGARGSRGSSAPPSRHPPSGRSRACRPTRSGCR